MSDNLTDFLTDLATNEDLRKAFKNDAKGTMKDKGIPNDDIDLVINKDYDAIQKRLGANYEISKNHIIDAFNVKK